MMKHAAMLSGLLLLGGGLGLPIGLVAAAGETGQTLAKIAGFEPQTLLKRLGARMEDGPFGLRVTEYERHFDRIDLDRDGQHSKEEFIEKGFYLNPIARRGIFNAADRNRDGTVTKAEYVLNRIITDEAKSIMDAMDDDEDRRIQKAEFVLHAQAMLGDTDLVEKVFLAFDSDRSGDLLVPEYLRVWGGWARAEGRSAELRLSTESVKRQRSESSEVPIGRPAAGQFSADRLFRFDRDGDGDGSLSRSELPAFFRDRVLERLDADDDGSITRREAELLDR